MSPNMSIYCANEIEFLLVVYRIIVNLVSQLGKYFKNQNHITAVWKHIYQATMASTSLHTVPFQKYAEFKFKNTVGLSVSTGWIHSNSGFVAIAVSFTSAVTMLSESRKFDSLPFLTLDRSQSHPGGIFQHRLWRLLLIWLPEFYSRDFESLKDNIN